MHRSASGRHPRPSTHSSRATVGPARNGASKDAAETEAELWREFVRCRSVAELATGIAARLANGTTPADLIRGAGIAQDANRPEVPGPR
jgi:hypothetical protein